MLFSELEEVQSDNHRFMILKEIASMMAIKRRLREGKGDWRGWNGVLIQ